MARETIPLNPDTIPFAEGAPSDELQVEAFGDNEVLIGDPELDFVEEVGTDFDSNIAELIPEEELDQANTQRIMNRIEHTKLRAIVSEITICFDPDDGETLIDSDALLMSQYKEFESILAGCLADQEQPKKDGDKSKWIIRMEMNAEEMLDRGITMEDVNFAIRNASTANS